VTFRSRSAYREFVASVRGNYRYVRTPEQQAFLDAVKATAPERAITMKVGYVLWRAQLGHDWRTHEQDGVSYEVETAHNVARMKPVADKASDGRVSPRGIPCLYLATQEDTAILEVRPLIGSFVSVAQFKTRRELRLVDCSRKEIDDLAFLDPNLCADDVDKIVWSNMNRAFSEPVRSRRGKS